MNNIDVTDTPLFRLSDLSASLQIMREALYKLQHMTHGKIYTMYLDKVCEDLSLAHKQMEQLYEYVHFRITNRDVTRGEE